MKKSLLFGIPFAMIAMAFFAGCPQSTSDDNPSPSKDPGAYEVTVEDIAIAFADGADKVYLKSDLILGSDEVVIPVGKTLDLSRGVTIGGITKGGKIVVAGDIEFPQNTNDYDILLYKYSGHIITSEAFKGKNIEIIVPENGNFIAKDDSKHIKALASQVVNIGVFNNPANESEWTAYVAENPDTPYMAIQYSGDIGDEGAKNINKYAYGKILYIIGDVKIIAEIDLTKAPVTNLYNVVNADGSDVDSSLVIGGKVVISGPNATVSTLGGFTVFGTLNTEGSRGDNNYVNKKGPLVAYYLDMVSGGSNFNDTVKLIGKFPSNFYTNASFRGDFTANGKVIFTKVEFGKGTTVIFNGPVEFRGEEGDIITDGATVKVYNSISFLNEDKALAQFDLEDGATLTFEKPYDGGSVGVFNSFVTFNSDAKFSNIAALNAGSITFNKGAMFNGNVTFGAGIAGSVGGGVSPYANNATITFGKPVTFEQDAFYGSLTTANAWYPGFTGNVVFQGRPTFKKNVSFGTGGVKTFENGLILEGGGTFAGPSNITGGDFTFPERIDLLQGAQIVYGNTDNITITGITSAGGTITTPATTTVKLTGGKTLSIAGGTLTAATVNIDINGAGQVFIDGSAPVASGVGLALNSGTISAASYKLDGGATGGGGTTSILRGSLGKITLTGTEIQGAGESPRLIFAGTAGAVKPWINMTISDDLDINGARIVLSDNNGVGTISLGITDQTVVIRLSGSDGTVPAGGIDLVGNTGGSLGLVLGDAVSKKGSEVVGVNAGYIVVQKGAGAGTFVAGTMAGTAVYKADAYGSLAFAGSQGTISKKDAAAVLLYGTTSDIRQFVLSPVKVVDNNDVKTLVENPSNGVVMTSKYGVVADVDKTGGSIAVFGQYVGTIATP
jgi:hypothetical protein